VHLSVKEIQAICMKAVPKKRIKNNKMVLDVQFSTDKKGRNNARPPDTAKLR